MDPNYFIVGAADPYVRLYDRRYPDTLVNKVAPRRVVERAARSHPHRETVGEGRFSDSNSDNDGDNDDQNISNRGATFVLPIHTTSVCYNYKGTQALATYSCENVYSLNIENVSPEIDTSSSEEDHGDGPDDDNDEQENDPAVYQMYSGHRNIRTVKEIKYLGPHSEYGMCSTGNH